MADANDMDLVRQFARQSSEAAFAEIVRRRINLVYSVALRFTANSEDAQDVTQAVFIILARKAAGLRERTVLTGWLYETTRFTAAHFMRTRARRQAREQEAYMQSTLNEPGSESVWRQLAPHLEAAMARLGESDRALLALRFYEDKSGPQAAALLGIREDTAHKRTARALEKLRKFFGQRGIALSAATIAGAVSAHSVQAAPVGLANVVTAVAVAKGAAAGGSTLALVKGALKLMAWTKAKTVIVVGVGALFAAGTTSVVISKAGPPSVDESLWALKQESFRKAPPVVIIRPTHFSDHSSMMYGEEIIAHNTDFKGLLERAYAYKQEGMDATFSRLRMIVPADAPQGRYDLMFTLPDHPLEALQQAINRKFGVVVRQEMRDTEVLRLKVKDPALVALHVNKRRSAPSYKAGEGKEAWANFPMHFTVNFLERAFNKPVLVQPGLSGLYDFTFQWPDPEHKEEALTRELEEAGLELVPARELIEMLVVERVKN